MEKEGYNLKAVDSSSATAGGCRGLYSKWICVQLKTRGSSSAKDTDVDKQLGVSPSRSPHVPSAQPTLTLQTWSFQIQGPSYKQNPFHQAAVRYTVGQGEVQKEDA